MDLKERVCVTLCNHKNCTSAGIAHLLNVSKIQVLRQLVTLINEGEVRQQKGRIVDGYPEPRWRSYKLAKEKYTPLQLFQEQ